MCRLVFRASLAPTENIDESCLAQQSLVRSPTRVAMSRRRLQPPRRQEIQRLLLASRWSLSSWASKACHLTGTHSAKNMSRLAHSMCIHIAGGEHPPPPLKVLPAWKEHPRWPCHPDCGNLASTFSATAQGLSFSSVSYARRNTAVYGFSVPKTAPKSYNKEYYAATCLVQ